MKNRKKIYIGVALLLIWMGVLFYFSNQDIGRSKELSQMVSGKILALLKLDDKNLPKLDHYIRKLAHFISYMFLSLLLIKFFISRGHGLKKSIYKALLISLVFAVTDEFHQLFVEGRRGSLKDIALDSGGAIFTGIVYWCMAHNKEAD